MISILISFTIVMIAIAVMSDSTTILYSFTVPLGPERDVPQGERVPLEPLLLREGSQLLQLADIGMVLLCLI